MEGWRDSCLSDVAEIVPGFAFKGKDFGSIGTKTIKIKDIISPYVDIQNADCIDVKHYDKQKLEKFNLFYGDFIVAMTGATIGKVGRFLHTESAYINQRVAKILPHKNVDKRFVYYTLVQDSFQSFIQNNIDSNSAQENISSTSIGNFPVLLPQLPEQQAIAAVLSSLDDKIDLLHRQNKTLEAVAQTLFRQWFVEEAEEGWQDTNFEKHFIVTRGLSYKGCGLSTCLNGIPLHNLNSIYEGGGYKHSGIKYYSEAFKDTHIVKPKDIIVSNTEQGHEFKLIGFPAVVSSEYGSFGIFSQHLYKIQPNENTYLTKEFLYYLILSSQVREQIISATNGSTVNMLSIDGLKRPQFKMPERKIISNFSVVIVQFWEQQEKNRQQIRTLTKLRDTLLPKLMSGEVRVTY